MEEVPSKFSCPVCCEVLKQPVFIVGCCHRFCYKCLLQTVKSPDGSVPCPICRTSFRLESDIKPDRSLEREMMTASTVCGACGTQLLLVNFNHHSLTCSKRSTAVPMFTPVAATAQNIRQSPNRSTFNCPLCSQTNLDCKALVDHANQFHANSSTAVVCPVCVCMPWGVADQCSQNFIQHLNLRHRFEYDTYVDYEQDDDAAMRAAIEASMGDK